MHHPIAYHQRERIKASLPVLRERGLDLVGKFYDRLFEVRPDTRSLFVKGEMRQRIKFTLMLHELVSHIDDWEWIQEAVTPLGVRHRKYGVRPEHFEVVGEVLSAVLADVLSDTWTDADREAWTTLYQEVSTCMISAGDEKAA